MGYSIALILKWPKSYNILELLNKDILSGEGMVQREGGNDWCLDSSIFNQSSKTTFQEVLRTDQDW